MLVCHEYEHMQEGLQWPYESRERRSNLKRTTRRIGETDFAYENESGIVIYILYKIYMLIHNAIEVLIKPIEN